LVVAAAGSSQVFVFFQSDGSFGPAGFAARTGPSPSSVTLADVNGDGRLDVVTTNDFSGDVSLFLNLGGRSFAAETRYRTGSGAYGSDDLLGRPVVRSHEEPSASVAGRFDGDAGADLIVTDRGANRFVVLHGDGRGGFLNPVVS